MNDIQFKGTKLNRNKFNPQEVLLEMIILHGPKIIALKARKVAGTSLEIALSQFATNHCIITPISPDDEAIRRDLGYRGPQNFDYSETGKSLFDILPRYLKKKKKTKFYNHMSAKLVKDRVDSTIWNEYAKIAVMRNPFDAAVSMYFWDTKRKNEKNRMDFGKWIIKNLDFLSMNKEIYRIDDQFILDQVIRYDTLEADISTLESVNPALDGLWNSFSNVNAKGGIRPKQATVSEMFRNNSKARDAIHHLFRDDIEAQNFEVPVVRN